MFLSARVTCMSSMAPAVPFTMHSCQPIKEAERCSANEMSLNSLARYVYLRHGPTIASHTGFRAPVFHRGDGELHQFVFKLLSLGP